MTKAFETIRGYRIKGRRGLQHWHALMEEWLVVVERYCRVAAGEDAPFVYNERANIGLVAGAAWRAGYTALEEFQYNKRAVGANKRKWPGRVDIYIASHAMEEMAEAKFAWFNLGKASAFGDRGNKTMALAVADAKATHATDKDINCLAIAFLAPYFSLANAERLDDRLDELVQEIDGMGWHAAAWCFPKEYRAVENEHGNATPGVIMAIHNPRFAE